MSENLYQLFSETEKRTGEYFPVDGPPDTHGFVLKSTKRTGGAHTVGYLNLIRGTGHGADARNRAESR